MPGPWEKYQGGGGSGAKSGPWDKYKPVPKAPSKAESAWRGALDMATYGTVDELAGGLDTVADVVKGDVDMGDGSLGNIVEGIKGRYGKNRDAYRELYKKAEEANPKTYMGAGLVGALAAPGAKGMGTLASEFGPRVAGAVGAVQGGLNAFGHSEGDSASEIAADTAMGAGLGGAVSYGAKKVTDAVAPKAKEVYDYVAEKLGKAGKKLLSTVGGVAEDTIDQYQAAPERINKARVVDEIAESLNQDVGRAAENRTQKTLDLIDSFQDAMKESAGHLGKMSEGADNALLKGSPSYQKEHVLGLIKKIGREIGPNPTSDEDVAAVNALVDYYQRVEQMPDTLKPTQVRELLRGLRKDITAGSQNAYNPNVMSNPTTTKAKRAIAETMQDTLKRDNPNYKTEMDFLANATKARSGVEDDFVTPERAASAIGRLSKGTQTPTTALRREALENFADTFGRSDLVEGVDDLSQMGYVDRLKPGRMKAIVQNQMRKNPNGVSARDLAALAKESGNDYSQEIADRAILDQFNRTAFNGSRNTNLGQGIGAAIGGGLKRAAVGGTLSAGGQLLGNEDEIDPSMILYGAAAGGLGGAALDRYGPRLTKALLDSSRSGALKMTRDEIERVLQTAAAKGPQALRAAQYYLEKKMGLMPNTEP